MHPTEFRHINHAYVFKNGTRAATLTRDGATITFAYEAAYLDSAGPPVASTLPLTDAPRTTTNGAVPAYFAGLLPEGRRLTALRRAAKASADDELTLLLASGTDPVGDVSVSAAPELPPTDTTQHTGEIDFSVTTFTDVLADAGIIDPSAPAGVQDKVSGRMLNVPLAFGGRAHLLKLPVPEYPHLIENEAFFLGQARHMMSASSRITQIAVKFTAN